MSMLDEVFLRDFFGMKQRDAMQAEQDRQNGIKREPPLTEQRVRERQREHEHDDPTHARAIACATRTVHGAKSDEHQRGRRTV